MFIRCAHGFFLVCFVLFGLGLFSGCPALECTKDSDCTGHHESCTANKCVHDDSKHHNDKDGGHDGGVVDSSADTGVGVDDIVDETTNDTTRKEPDASAKADEVQDKAPDEPDTMPDKGALVSELGRCDQERKCKQGLNCIVFSRGAKEGLCLRAVSSCAGASCGSGYQCTNTQTGGVCLRLCSSRQPCPNGLQCKHLHFPGGHGDACVP